MEEFFAALEACGARRVTRQEDVVRLRDVWDEHRRYIAGLERLECFGCDQLIVPPYAVSDGQARYCWCIKCVPGMLVFGEAGGDPVIGMRNFGAVIVCAWAGPVSRKETSDPP